MVIAADNPVFCTIYAGQNSLLNQPGWKWFKSFARRQKRILREISLAKLRKHTTRVKFKYGYEVPKDFKHAVDTDHTLWQDATKLELESMEAYQVFKDHGHKATPPPGYKVIRAHLIYDVKHDGQHKARLVADGHLTDIPDDSVYSSVVSLRGLWILLFLAELNGLEVWGTDI